MKELSIKEKAKRYNEAIEKAKTLLSKCKRVSDKASMIYRAEDIESMFPELKEVDDEQIRKWLISQLKIKSDVNNSCELELMILKSIAWLEKQEEQKSDINYLLSWSKIDEKMLQNLENIVKDYWAKAEKEKNEIKIREASNASYFLKTIQKSPLCWIKCSDGLPNRDGVYLVVTDGLYNEVYDLARYDSVEGWHKASEIIYWMPIPQLSDKTIIGQKSFWSEEDELFLKDAIEFIETGWSDKGKSHLVYWLKSIKNRIIWNSSEKQSEHAKFLNSIQVGDQVTRNEDGELFNLSQLNRVAKPNKQKSVDKVEPKFKVGNWITCPEFLPTPSTVAKVVYIVDDQYDLEYLDGTKEVSAIDKVDSTYYHWTIEDAKDGDVLVGKIDGDSYILIYKQIKDGWIETYGHYYDSVDRFCVPSQLFCREVKGTFHPATKEQRDFLFQKMKKAGYEWNEEKKELKNLKEESENCK